MLLNDYQGIYLRKNLAQTDPNLPGSDICFSPDIIPFQKDYVDPGTFIMTDNWTRDLGKSVLVNENNYVYIRGNNNADSVQKGKLELNYAPSNLVLFPNAWADNKIPVGDDPGKFALEFEAQPNALWVAGVPFQWKAMPLPIGADHYCLVARINEEVPTYNMSWDDLYAWIKKPNVGWRNVNLVTGDTPDWERHFQLNLPEKTDIPPITQAYIYVEFSLDMPLGVQVSFSCPGQDASPEINYPVTTYDKKGQLIGMWSNLQKGFDHWGTLSFWSRGNTIPSGASVKLTMTIVESLERLTDDNMKDINKIFSRQVIDHKFLFNFNEYYGTRQRRVGGINNLYKY